jgi:hypothetical protein
MAKFFATWALIGLNLKREVDDEFYEWRRVDGREDMRLLLAPVVASAVIAASSACTTADGQTRVQVVPVVYKPNGPGDFSWMRKRPEYADSYFVFNDNQEQFVAHQKDAMSDDGCTEGGGNAVARPWQCETPPRAGGVPTGANGVGYQELTPEVRQIIDEAIATIKLEVLRHKFKRVFYSSCAKGAPNCALDDDLGTEIFHVSEAVRAYIVSRLKGIAE